MHRKTSQYCFFGLLFLPFISAQICAEDTTVIDLMVVWSKQADADADVNSIAYEQVDAVNTCLKNSEIAVKIRPVYVGMIDYDETGIGAGQSHDYFKVGGGPLAFTQNLRDDVGADLCCLIVKSSEIVGRSTAWSEDGAKPDRVFITLSLTYVGNGYFVLPHELGHTLGCTHAPGESQSQYSAAFSYSHAHSFEADGWEYSTIMCASYSKSSSILYYSNPDVKYKGVPTGIAEERDNARTIRQTASIVAQFRPAVMPVMVGNSIININSRVKIRSLSGSGFLISELFGKAEIQLFSATGRLLPCRITPFGNGAWMIQKGNLSSGVYALRIKQEGTMSMFPLRF